MRNVVMSPWPSDRSFITRLIAEFKKVLNEEVKVPGFFRAPKIIVADLVC